MSVKEVIKRLAPGQIAWVQSRRYYYGQLSRGEHELRILPAVVPHGCTAIDVGANNGVYSYHLSRRAKRVIAFEPNPTYVEKLKWARLPKNVEIRPIALSSSSGEAILSIPRGANGQEAGGWGTLRPINSESRSIQVEIRTLDSYDLGNVGFVKIDVEGHEEAVVAGAWQTISRSHPALLIECEERHCLGVTERLPRRLREIGYSGYFYEGNTRRPMQEFSAKIHQAEANMIEIGGDPRSRGRAYINNFLFLHD